jgi:hypothetical protein
VAIDYNTAGFCAKEAARLAGIYGDRKGFPGWLVLAGADGDDAPGLKTLAQLLCHFPGPFFLAAD